MKSAILLVFLSASAIVLHAGSRAATPVPSGPVKVQEVEIRQETRRIMEQVVGTVTARNKPIVSAQINGTVLNTFAETGQRVKAGELLAELASPEADARLSGAKASVDLATREFARSQQLVASGTVSKESHDQATAALQSARAAMKEAETAVTYKHVRAPIDGVIRVRRVDPGEITSPGKPLFEMEDERSLRFEANVAESLSGSLAPGTEVGIHIDSADKKLSGTLSEITPSADPVSRTFLVRFDLPETTGVVAGQFGRALLPAGEAPVIMVPASAVVERGQMEIVYVIAERTARLRLVRTGKKSGNEVELLAGVQPGERIAASNTAQLIDGVQVEVE